MLEMSSDEDGDTSEEDLVIDDDDDSSDDLEREEGRDGGDQKGDAASQGSEGLERGEEDGDEEPVDKKKAPKLKTGGILNIDLGKGKGGDMEGVEYVEGDGEDEEEDQQSEEDAEDAGSENKEEDSNDDQEAMSPDENESNAKSEKSTNEDQDDKPSLKKPKKAKKQEKLARAAEIPNSVPSHLQKQYLTDKDLNLKTKALPSILKRDYAPNKLPEKVADFEKYTDKMDMFVKRQEASTKKLIGKVKDWNRELDQIYEAFEDNKIYWDAVAKDKGKKKKKAPRAAPKME